MEELHVSGLKWVVVDLGTYNETTSQLVCIDRLDKSLSKIKNTGQYFFNLWTENKTQVEEAKINSGIYEQIDAIKKAIKEIDETVEETRTLAQKDLILESYDSLQSQFGQINTGFDSIFEEMGEINNSIKELGMETRLLGNKINLSEESVKELNKKMVSLNGITKAISEKPRCDSLSILLSQLGSSVESQILFDEGDGILIFTLK